MAIYCVPPILCPHRISWLACCWESQSLGLICSDGKLVLAVSSKALLLPLQASETVFRRRHHESPAQVDVMVKSTVTVTQAECSCRA